MEARDRLPEAVSLLEFAHRDANRACPQSVCTTQDLAVTYGLIDGKGYQQQRLNVAAETLERIDPSWPCFTCISSEYADALLADGRHEEAIVFLEEQYDKLRRAHLYEQRYWQMLSPYLEALIHTDRLEEALEINNRARRHSDSQHQADQPSDRRSSDPRALGAATTRPQPSSRPGR